jgi:superfamily II DNA/RNA helicase
MVAQKEKCNLPKIYQASFGLLNNRYQMRTWNEYPMPPELRQSLDTLGYTQPTNTQKYFSSPKKNLKNLIMVTQNGSGKAIGHLIKICDCLHRVLPFTSGCAIMFSPTRESATHLLDMTKKMTHLYDFSSISQKKHLQNDFSKRFCIITASNKILHSVHRGKMLFKKYKQISIEEIDTIIEMGLNTNIYRAFTSLSCHLPSSTNHISLNHNLGTKIRSYYICSRSMSWFTYRLGCKFLYKPSLLKVIPDLERERSSVKRIIILRPKEQDKVFRHTILECMTMFPITMAIKKK